MFGTYPKLELGMVFLMYREGKKVSVQNSSRRGRREKHTNEAYNKMEEAKTLFDE